VRGRVTRSTLNVSTVKQTQAGAALGERIKSFAVAPALFVSAYLMAIAIASPSYWWLGWITLLPLFHAIRVFRPSIAGLCGGFWGASLYVCSALMGNPSIDTSALSLIGLSLVPALYATLGASLTRHVGFSPYLLALGWIGVEFALQPLGLSTGLLAATQGDGFAIRIVGSFAGYVLVAFLVAYFNAALLSALAEACVPSPARRSPLRGASPLRRFYTLDVVLELRDLLRQAQPRGPPLLVPATLRRGW